MKNIDKHIDISRLLWKKLNDSLSAAEKEQLDRLFENDPSLEKWFNEFRDQHHIDQRLEEYFKINVREKWNAFYPGLKHKSKLRKYARYSLRAAAIILPLAIVFFVVSEIKQDINSTMADTVIVPGSSKAILTLSDGSKVKLQKESLDTIYDVGTEIKSTGEALQYAQKEEKKAIQKFEVNEIEIPRGGEFQIVLGDGTRVWLNSETNIKYLVPFGVKNRIVEIMSGEAYFEVAHNKELPFRVKTNDGVITALGTAFNVRAYSNEPYSATTLAEGKVSVEMLNNNLAYLSPGEQAVYAHGDQSLEVAKVDLDRYLMWKNGEFMFVNDRLEEIITDLARWYDFDVFFEQEYIKDIRFTLYLDRDKGINKILELLQRTKRIEFEISEKHILVKKK